MRTIADYVSSQLEWDKSNKQSAHAGAGNADENDAAGFFLCGPKTPSATPVSGII